MTHTYNISGMTCNGCVASVKQKLEKLDEVQEVDIDLENSKAAITMFKHIPLSILKAALPEKYTITIQTSEDENLKLSVSESKLKQLKPLLLIFAYLFVASMLLNFNDWNTQSAMLDFMGLFYIVFSFFKFLDLRGFPKSFKMYDPLAKAIPIYGWVYPFLELLLGVMFLMRFQIKVALITTIMILGITTVGVTKTLLDKKSIRCACLGTALNLPMTEATFIENSVMLVMAISMLLM